MSLVSLFICVLLRLALQRNKPPLILNISSFDHKQVREVSELHKLCFDEPWSEQLFTTLLENPHVCGFLAHTSGNELTGLLLGQITPGEAEIYTLATHPDYHRQGVASHLIEKLIVGCLPQSVQRILLEVNETNLPALKFYEEVGFIAYGRRKKYYMSSSQHYNDAILFELKVK